MSEYEIYTRILSPCLKPENQRVLVEDLGYSLHMANIIEDKKTIYSLYRYDQVEQKNLFLPFFNNSHDGEMDKSECPTLEDLLKFCDYILLAEKNDRLFVLLLELKSGNNGDAHKQLEASATFMEYVKNTAIRIAEVNGYLNFKKENIKLKKIVLKPAPKVRPLTNKSKSKQLKVDYEAPIIYYTANSLPLYCFCR